MVTTPVLVTNKALTIVMGGMIMKTLELKKCAVHAEEESIPEKVSNQNVVVLSTEPLIPRASNCFSIFVLTFLQ